MLDRRINMSRDSIRDLLPRNLSASRSIQLYEDQLSRITKLKEENAEELKSVSISQLVRKGLDIIISDLEKELGGK